ncbi:lysozyme inhibitor LprI family protein [Pantoea sp. SGAir0183]
MKSNKLTFMPALLSSLMLVSSCYASGDIGSNIIGQWIVENVYVDGNDSSRPDFISNDPNLVGRVINFDKNSISGSILVANGCASPSYNKKDPITVAQLLNLTAGESENEKNDLANDYGLPLVAKNTVVPYEVNCKSGMFGPSGEKIGNWIVEKKDGELLTNWNSQSYLLLKRLPANVKPMPSFNCIKASTDTEKAICSNNELAGWDRSVAQAYSIAVKQIKSVDVDVKSKLSMLLVSQNNWIKKRNECKGDEKCLSEKMQNRVSELVEQSK